jgi:hypothetical protein
MLATSPWPFLLRLQELSKYPTGATSRLMNTSNSSMKELESKVNGVVLTTTCITLLMERALSNHWVLNYQDMLEDFPTMTLLETSPPQLLEEMMTRSLYNLTLVSPSLVNGTLISIFNITCLLDIIYSMMRTDPIIMFLTLPLCITSKRSWLKTTHLRLYYLKVPQTLRYASLSIIYIFLR